MGVYIIMKINVNNVLTIVLKYMKDNKMSLSQYAKKAGISKAWLSRMFSEKSKNISLDVAQNLLNVSGYCLEIKKSNINIVKIKRLGKCHEITK